LPSHVATERPARASCGRPVKARNIPRFVLIALCASCYRIAPGFAQEPYGGKWFRATGNWDGKEFVVQRLQWREAEKEATRALVSGVIDGVDSARRSFRVGPITVTWSNSTDFKGVELDALKKGDLVRASGRLVAPRELTAVSIVKTDNALLQLTGLADSATVNADGSVSLTLLGTPTRLIQPGYGEVKLLTLRQDSRRPDKQLTVELFDRALVLGGEYAGGLLYRRNLRLEDKKRDERVEFGNELTLEAFYPWSDSIAAFVTGKVIYNAELYRRGDGREVEKALERGQSWVYFGRLGGTGLGLQVGRQNIAETREWWWDDDLDALRLYYDYGPLHTEIAVAQEVARKSTLDSGGIDPEKKDLTRLLGFASWTWAPRQRLEFFAARQDDRSETQSVASVINADREDRSDAKLNWLGARAIGDYGLVGYGDVRYWLDTGWVHGAERQIDFKEHDSGGLRVESVHQSKVRGWAFDAGASWELPLAWRPNITLGLARGSGGGSGDVDRSYRQTGLHANKWRFKGVKRFRYYGELLQPELSNLNVATLGVGMPLLNSSSLDLVYHKYRQVHAKDSLRDARLSADPNGVSTDIGQELDLVLDVRESRRFEYTLIASFFRGGDAYKVQPERDAYRLLFELTYNF
jgi:alginate production protein